jgi:hypothetical protein
VFTVDASRDLVTGRVGVLVGGWEGSLGRSYSLATGVPRPAPSGWADVLARCKPGVSVGELRAARVHGTGMGYEALDDHEVLEAGMVVAVENEADAEVIADELHITAGGHESLSGAAF